MPNWKKLIVSGSDASLNSLNVTNNVTAQSFTGSFSGSFTAPGATTQVVYNSGGVLAASSNFVFSGSRVGIGTTTPVATLHVSGSGRITGDLIVSGSTLNRATKITDSGFYLSRTSEGSYVSSITADGAMYYDTRNDHIFRTDGTENFRIVNSTGNVGIGTTSPSARTHIIGAGSSYATTAFLVQNSSTTNSFSVKDSVGNYNSNLLQVIAGNWTDSAFYTDQLWRTATFASARDITIGSDGTLNGYSSRLNFVNYYYNNGQGNQSNYAGYIRTSISQYTATGGGNGNQDSGRGTLLLGVYDSDYSSNVLNSFDVVSIGKYATVISGSLNMTGGGITGSLLGTASYATYALGAGAANSATSASYALIATSASYALTASYVNTLNQTVIITGSLGVGVTSLGSTENTLVLGPAPAGGSGEGGQILLQAQGGSYTSASMLDTYQNKFRLLRGTNAGSDAYKLQLDLQTGQLQLPNYNSPTAFTGTTLVGLVGFDSSGNLLTTQTSSAALSGGSTNYVARWASSATLTTGSIYDTGTNVGIGITSPSSKLHVTDTSNPTINIGTLNGNTGNAGIQFYSGTGGSNNGFLLQYIKNGSTDRFGFIDGGSVERLTVLNGGNVGIGTTAPSYKLQVNGDGNGLYVLGANTSPYTQTIATFVYGGNNNSINIENQGGKASFQARDASSNPMNLHINPVGGNVGIGTTSPSQVLEVQGQAQIGNDSVTSAGLFIARKNTNQAKSHYFLSAQESPTYQWIEGGYFTSELAGVSVANNSGKPYYEAYIPAGQYKAFGFINQQTSGSSFTSTAATASMVLYQGGDIALAPTQGNVGIGTTAPAASLHTIGSTNFTQIVQSTTSIAYTQYYNSSTGTGGTNDGLTIGLNGTSGLVYLRENADLFFGTADTERMRITSAGNIGIGTSSPSTKLDVIGNSYISGSLSVKTTSTAGTGLTVGGSTVLLSFAEIQQGNAFYFYSSGNTYNSTISQNGQNLILNPDTNVGIGTTSPSQKLDVAGAISVSGSVVDYEVAPALIGGITTTNIISFTPGTHYAAFVDYVIKDASTGANQRVGTIQVSISLAGAAAVMNEVTTIDIGNTSAITFAVSYGAPTWLTATNSGPTPYDINYMVRYF